MNNIRQIADTLIEALPYIQEFAGEMMVIKYGGAAMSEHELKKQVMQDVALLRNVGINPVLVHGGGPEITSWMNRLGLKAQFREGLRVSDEQTVELVEMVLCGKVNKEMAALLCSLGVKAVGMSGKDAGLFSARKITSPKGEDLGWVGEITSVDVEVLRYFVDNKLIPVVATVGVDESGHTLNLNADHVAGAVAGALKARKLIILTDVPGILEDVKDESSVISLLSIQQARELLDAGKIEKGMVPKVRACLQALEEGVQSAHIIDGRVPHSLLMEIFTRTGIGTMINPNGTVPKW